MDRSCRLKPFRGCEKLYISAYGKTQDDNFTRLLSNCMWCEIENI